MKKIIIIAILLFLIVGSSTALGYTKQFRGFVFNLNYDSKPSRDYYPTNCKARVLIGRITTWNHLQKIYEKTCILRKIELRNVIVTPPNHPQPWLRLNYWLGRTIVFPIYVFGMIVE
jgi:hypothetical protein